MKRKETLHISNIIPQVLQNNHLNSKLNETKIVTSWNTVVGKQIAHYTKSIYIKGGILYVSLTSSIVRGELSMSREILIEKLNNITGKSTIKDIIFK